MTALRPGQSPPPVSIATLMGATLPTTPPDLARIRRRRHRCLGAAGDVRRTSVPPMSVVIAIDAGTTGVRSFAVAGRRHAGGLRRTASSRSTSRPRARSSTTPTTSGRRPWRPWPSSSPGSTARPWRPSASPTSARRRWSWDRRTGRPLHRALVWQDRRTAARCEALAAAGHLAARPAHDRPGARPLLLGHEAGVAAHRGRRRRPTPDLAFGTVDSLAAVEPDRRTRGRRARHRAVERQPHPAVRHRDPGLVRAELVDLFGVPASCLPEVRPSAGASASPPRALPLPAGLPVSGDPRRPAGGPVRPGVLRARDDQEHLRHGQLRADERGRPPAPSRSRDCSPPWRGPASGDGRHVRPRGRDLRDRRRGAVAARRARADRRRRRRRPARRLVRRHRGRLPGARVHRAGQPVVGPVRPGHDRRASPGAPRPPTWPGPWSRRWPTRPATWSRP